MAKPEQPLGACGVSRPEAVPRQRLLSAKLLARGGHKGVRIVDEYCVLAVAATILFGANAVCTYAVCRSDFYESRQKIFQVALVWLVPIFGLLLVGGVLWSNYARPRTTGDHPEHKIPEFVLTGRGPDNFQNGGPST